jgi:hypothetical protein
MSYFDAYADKRHLLGGSNADLVARLSDFLERKSQVVPEKLEALCKSIETRVSSLGLGESLRQLVTRLRRDPDLPGTLTSDADWQLLVEKIQCYGRQESIENYTAYFFSFEGMSDVEK